MSSAVDAAGSPSRPGAQWGSTPSPGASVVATLTDEQRGRQVVDDLKRLLRLSPCVETMNAWMRAGFDPGTALITVQATARRLKVAVTLAEYREIEGLAMELAAKILKGEAWLEEAKAKVRFQPAATRPAFEAQIKERDTTLATWRMDLEMLEHQMVRIWSEYLAAQPDKRMIYQRPDGQKIILSSRPIIDAPHPVFTPEAICAALRIGRTLNPDILDELGPERFLAEYADIDPLTLALPSAKKKRGGRATSSRASSPAPPGNANQQQGTGFGKL